MSTVACGNPVNLEIQTADPSAHARHFRMASSKTLPRSLKKAWLKAADSQAVGHSNFPTAQASKG
jgi:hypothetical protein